jgi:homoserine dehydrogenase
MTHPLSVAIAGLGTVGGGVLKLLRANADIIAARAGRPITVTAVSARDRTRDRGVSLTGLRWYEDPVALAADPAIDVVVELIGGSDGPAHALVQAAASRGTCSVGHCSGDLSLRIGAKLGGDGPPAPRVCRSAVA